jgi:hypothetical protein
MITPVGRALEDQKKEGHLYTGFLSRIQFAEPPIRLGATAGRPVAV